MKIKKKKTLQKASIAQTRGNEIRAIGVLKNINPMQMHRISKEKK